MMNVRDFECRSFEQAKELLGNRDSRKVCNNTVLRRSGLIRICLDLHGHTIVDFFGSGTMALYTRGWLTVTTRSRMNKVLPRPWYIVQRKHVWYVWSRDDGREYKFVDGMSIYPDGPEQIRTAALLRGVVEQA